MTSFVLKVALPVLLFNQLAFAYSNRFYVHPLFDHAANLPNPTQGFLRRDPIYKNRNASVLQNMDERVLKIYQAQEYDSELYRYVPESSFETGMAGSEYSTGIYIPIRQSVSDERTRIRNYNTNDCLGESFRAFELVLWDHSRNMYLGIGMGQGPGLCVLRYKENAPLRKSGDIFKNIESVQRIDGPLTAYRVTSIAGIEKAPHEWQQLSMAASVLFVDEAGYSYTYNIKENKNGQLYMAFNSALSLSAYDFDTDSEAPFGNLDFKAHMTTNEISRKMKAHFHHCFTEAIALYKDKLIYSRGLDLYDQPRLRVASPSSSGTAFTFLELTESSSKSEKFVNALEMYDYAGQVIVHMGISRRLDDVKRLKAEPEYFFCNLTSIGVFRSADFHYLRPITDADITCVKRQFHRNYMPIDIVYMPHCDRTVFFYEHWYHETTPNKAFDGANEKSFEKKYIKWMNRPINAILYSNHRLYLFTHGSDVMISKPHDACSWEDVEFEPSTYTQSQLILHFEKHAWAQEVPLFHSGRSFYRVDGQSARFGAYPGLEAGPIIDTKLMLISGSSSDPNGSTTTTTPVPSPGKPKPKPSSSTSIIIIATIVIMILAAGLFAVYYFCFGDTEEPLVKRRKSNLLQNRKTLRSEADKKPIQVPPGSALASVSTVRSDIVVPSSMVSKSAMKATTNPIQHAASGKSAGSSPMSTYRGKSRSPGLAAFSKSKEALRSKRSSPKSPGLTAKTTSNSKKLNMSKTSAPKSSSDKAVSPRVEAKPSSKIEKPSSASPSTKSKIAETKSSPGPRTS